MAWQDEMVPLLRGVIGDTSLTSSTYSDSSLIEFLVYAAHFVIKEMYFSNKFAVDITELSISPDPSTLSTKDTSFMNSVVLKAAIFILQGEVRSAASQSVRITDGPSSIDLSLMYRAKKELLELLKKDYDNFKVTFSFGDGSVGEAILTPYTQENSDTTSYYR